MSKIASTRRMGPKPKPLIERFWTKVDKKTENECWEWKGAKDKDGYGVIWYNSNQRAARAHRVSYILTHKTIPENGCICHSCDNPGCVNPSHLWCGTSTENNTDKILKNRSARLSGNKNPSAKWYYVKCPDGKVVEVFCLKMFCDDHNLSYGAMKKVSQGKSRQHYGFTIIGKETQCE